jgi:CHAT domain-containing protein
MLAVQDPRGDLSGAECEIKAISSIVGPENMHVLVGSQVSSGRLRDALLQAAKETSLHFACHGQYDEQRRWESHLVLADEDRLTAADIVASDLSKFNLVVMSACESALSDFETDDYVTLLKQSQSNLEQAIQDKNVQQLQSTRGEVNQELHKLHDALLSLNLKSDEVDQIRQNLLAANQQLLNMPLLHGQTDLSKIDFAKIEKQFNSIQMDMVKLATLVLGDKTDSNA